MFVPAIEISTRRTVQMMMSGCAIAKTDLKRYARYVRLFSIEIPAKADKALIVIVV